MFKAALTVAALIAAASAGARRQCPDHWFPLPHHSARARSAAEACEPGIAVTGSAAERVRSNELRMPKLLDKASVKVW